MIFSTFNYEKIYNYIKILQSGLFIRIYRYMRFIFIIQKYKFFKAVITISAMARIMLNS